MNAVTSRGLTVIYMAADLGNEICVQCLIYSGADVNILSRRRESPLMRAARNGHLQCVQLLLSAGAGVNLARDDGFTAFLLAAKKDQLNCVRLLIKVKAFINRATVIRIDEPNEICEILRPAGATVKCDQEEEEDLSMMNMRRDALPRHLLRIGEPVNLFHKVPLLGLPSLMKKYFLYNVSLD